MHLYFCLVKIHCSVIKLFSLLVLADQYSVLEILHQKSFIKHLTVYIKRFEFCGTRDDGKKHKIRLYKLFAFFVQIFHQNNK